MTAKRTTRETNIDFTEYDHDHPTGTGWIRTVNGQWVNLIEPTTGMIRLDDISHALAHINRFGGHTYAPYSVAEHSLHVSAMLLRQFGDQQLALHGLLHDAAEAYLGDVVRPLKQALPEYRAIETRMMDTIASKFGLEPRFWRDARVFAADQSALVWEMATVRDSWFRVAPEPGIVAANFDRVFEDLVAAVRTDRT